MIYYKNVVYTNVSVSKGGCHMNDFGFDLTNPGIALAIMGYFGFIFKDIPSRIWSIIQQRFSVTFNASSMDNTYQFTMDWLLSRFPDFKKHIQLRGYNSIEWTIADGTYFFMVDPLTYILINKFYIEQGNYGLVYLVKGQIIGLNRCKVLEEYKDTISKRIPDKETHLSIAYRGYDGYISILYTGKRSFDDIFLKKGMKEDIINIIDNFLSNYNYYKEHGITYKMGILLSGKPGSGKSSTAKAIASYLGWKVYYMNASNIQFDSLLSNTVVLIEDIDCLLEESREKKNDNDDKSSDDYQPKLPMHELLNYLDGILSPTNCIFIATTNYPERIDPALIRPGRFDYHFEIDYADEEVAKQVCDRFRVDYSILDDIKLPCSVSTIQNKIIIKK